jgi:hypothetical protein
MEKHRKHSVFRNFSTSSRTLIFFSRVSISRKFGFSTTLF